MKYFKLFLKYFIRNTDVKGFLDLCQKYHIAFKRIIVKYKSEIIFDF